MKTVVFGGAVAGLVGLIFGAGMKAPVAGQELPHPELQQISYPVETVSHESFRPEYVVASAYATTDWAADRPMMWRAAYAAPTAVELEALELEDQTVEEPSLNADPYGADAVEPTHRGDATMPYAAGMTTRPDAEREQAPETRPTSSWPNKRGDAKQHVFNGRDGFEHVPVTDAAA